MSENEYGIKDARSIDRTSGKKTRELVGALTFRRTAAKNMGDEQSSNVGKSFRYNGSTECVPSVPVMQRTGLVRRIVKRSFSYWLAGIAKLCLPRKKPHALNGQHGKTSLALVIPVLAFGTFLIVQSAAPAAVQNETERWQELYNRVIEAFQEGRYEDGVMWAEQTYELARRAFGKRHRYTPPSQINLAAMYMTQARYSEAEPLLEQALQLSREVLGERHPSTLTSMNNLAGLWGSNNVAVWNSDPGRTPWLRPTADTPHAPAMID